MLVDWEAVVLDLRKYMLEKPGNSYGHAELSAKLDALTIQHRQVEGLPEKALRLYGSDLADALSHRQHARSLEGPRETAQ
jgi:hypothetical protein